MASLRNALSSLIPGLNSDLFIGVHFHPDNEEGIGIVNRRNADWQLLPIFKECGYLFQRPPEQLEEGYWFTKLKLIGKNKVDRTIPGDRSRRYWKNVTDSNNKSIGYCVTKLVLLDKQRPTEWHIVEYRDTEKPTADRYVLCHLYKLEKKNDRGRGYENQAQCSNAQPDWVSNAETNPLDQSYGVDQSWNPPLDGMDYNSQQFPSFPNDPVESDIGAGQICPSTSQFSSMRASGATQLDYEMGQCSYTQPDCLFNPPTYPHPTGEHMNQDQIHWYTPQDGTSNNTSSTSGIYMGPYQNSNRDQGSDFGMDELSAIFNNPGQS